MNRFDAQVVNLEILRCAHLLLGQLQRFGRLRAALRPARRALFAEYCHRSRELVSGMLAPT